MAGWLKYTKEDLEKAAAISISITQVMKILGYKSFSGGSHSHISRKLKQYEIDISHFLGQASNKGRIIGPKKTPEEIFVHNKNQVRRTQANILRQALLSVGREYKCYICGLREWRRKSIVLEIEHKNGDWTDNTLENIEFICPNCHSQTETYGSKKFLLTNKKVKPSLVRDRKRRERIKKETNPFWRNQDKPNIRKVERPPKETLEKLLLTTPVTVIGKNFGVSDNAVRKWAKRYHIDLKICGVWNKAKINRANNLKEVWASGGIEDTPDLESGA